jgi:hypothetical protein
LIQAELGLSSITGGPAERRHLNRRYRYRRDRLFRYPRSPDHACRKWRRRRYPRLDVLISIQIKREWTKFSAEVLGNPTVPQYKRLATNVAHARNRAATLLSLLARN